MVNVILQRIVECVDSIHYICPEENTMLLKEIGKIAGVIVIPMPLRLMKLPFLSNFVNFVRLKAIRRQIRLLQPDCIVAVQGNIEISSLILLAARMEKVKVVTYIALAQTMSELSVKYAWLRDQVDKVYFSLPDRFIAISESQKHHLVSKGVNQNRIAVVPNVVCLGSLHRPTKNEARSVLGLDQTKFHIGMLGRIVFAHKGQDILVDAFRQNYDQLRDTVVLVVGSGPDEVQLRELVTKYDLENNFRFLPWTDDMSTVYAALDCVVMPSHHEGVPLVMLEACLHGLPVLAASIDGMKDYLPEEWLFGRGAGGDMVQRITTVIGGGQEKLIAEVRRRFESIFQRGTLGEEFMHELRVTIG